MRVQKCKGSRDLFPEDMAKFRLVEGAFRDCCLKWGYEEVRTPTLEYLYLFTSTGTLTPGLLGRVYSFLDWDGWSGERVVLRPDGTIPVARLYIDGLEGKELAKLFYLANVFIFEETGEETREKWQCGAELIGGSSPLGDVELIMLASEVLERVGLGGVEVRLSHAGLIRAMLDKLGLSPEERARVFGQILDGDRKALARVEREGGELGKALPLVIDLKGGSSGFLKNLKALFVQNSSEFERCLDDFIRIVDLLEVLGGKYQIDLASGRGFEYYTGVIFQLFVNGERVGGGGRYDALVPLMGGRDIPASGFALYLDPLMNLIKPEPVVEPLAQGILVRVKPDEPEVMREGFGIARRLREAGYVTEFDLAGRKRANLVWSLDVQSKAPLFVLTDQVKRKRFEAQSADEVLAALNRCKTFKRPV